MAACCGARHPEHRALCTVEPGHDGDHQAYYGNRLITWP